jgi:hypothetical protein
MVFHTLANTRVSLPKIHRPAIGLSHTADMLRGNMSELKYSWWLRLAPTFILTILLAGCSFKRHGMAFDDEYESVRVEQTVGNHVSGRIFERTLLCLNPRRETRRAPAVTNVLVTYQTNVSLSYVTNQTITVTTNQNRTAATNLIATIPPPPPSVTETNEAPAETNQVVQTTPPSTSTTNDSVSVNRSSTLSKSPNQVATTVNQQTLLTHQITVSTNNVTLTTAEQQAISAETNLVVTTVTNVAVTPHTNVVMTHTNVVLRDYFIYAELTPPPDFQIASGESLVILADGVRYGLTQTNTTAALHSRRGFSTYTYKVPPQALVDIANAQTVKVRLRGNNTVIEKKMSHFARNSFRRFILKYFTPEPSAEEELQAQQITNQPES